MTDAAAARLLLAVQDALSMQDRVHLCLTGGSLGSAVLAAAGRSPLVDLVDWSRVHLWWGDERFLAAGDPDRNETQNGAALLDRPPLATARRHAVPGPDAAADAQAAATAYDEELAAAGDPTFDVVLLGMGPDGHVASLFPRHPAQRRRDTDAVAVEGSPKPPPTRVSLTFARLNRATQVWLLVAGMDKADAVCRALTPGADPWQVPAAGVRGMEQTLWLLDVDAASALPEGAEG